MRAIEVSRWKFDQGGKEIEENLLIALNSIISMRKFEEIPKGIEDFRTMQRIAKAFDDAEKLDAAENGKGRLALEEREYAYLKGLVENHVPSTWALNQNLSKAIDDFLNAKEEDKK